MGSGQLCFFGFFRSGEITVQSAGAFDPIVYLTWGDVSVDGNVPPSKIRIFLKPSKTDQFGQGIEVFVGATGDVVPLVAPSHSEYLPLPTVGGAAHFGVPLGSLSLLAHAELLLNIFL